MLKPAPEPALDGDRLLNRDISRLSREYPLLQPEEEGALSAVLQTVPRLLRAIAGMRDDALGPRADVIRALAAEVEAGTAARCKQVSARNVSEDLRKTVARGFEARKALAPLLRAAPPPSEDALKEWTKAIAALEDVAGENAARQKLQYSNVLLAKHHCHGDWDLFQENMIAILRATYTYDPAYGCRFSTYASNAIQFLRHTYSKRQTTVNVASYIQKDASRYREALERLQAADKPRTDEAVIAMMAAVEDEWKRSRKAKGTGEEDSIEA